MRYIPSYQTYFIIQLWKLFVTFVSRRAFCRVWNKGFRSTHNKVQSCIHLCLVSTSLLNGRKCTHIGLWRQSSAIISNHGIFSWKRIWFFAPVTLCRLLLRFDSRSIGGLEVACWPLVPKSAGSKPAEAVGFSGRKNPQRAFLRRGSKVVCPCRRFAAC
jgi:hypothetical protein